MINFKNINKLYWVNRNKEVVMKITEKTMPNKVITKLIIIGKNLQQQN